MNLDLLIQSFVRPVPFVSAFINYLTCCCRRRPHDHRPRDRTHCSTASARSNHCASSPHSMAVTEPQSPFGSGISGETKQCNVSKGYLKTRAHPIPEILLSSYDDEVSVEGRVLCANHRTRHKGISKLPPSEDNDDDVDDDEDVQITLEDGDEEDNEDYNDDDDDEGEWI
ncbi:hypothetical protein FGIG_07702 [Fasciola gigantica]|uniref:Uncharacterized protein n=1 Tax=Fasciola gigantica TaxID=46835 RepID=A0A504Z1K9_FASGI|nr:hypothetical protein FGIG_07702 [Fasciola gigantica]